MIAFLNGIEVDVRPFMGQGPLSVMTTRGEVKAQHGDYIVMFHGGASCVIPGSALEPILAGTARKYENLLKAEDDMRDTSDAIFAQTLITPISEEVKPPQTPPTPTDDQGSSGQAQADPPKDDQGGPDTPKIPTP